MPHPSHRIDVLVVAQQPGQMADIEGLRDVLADWGVDGRGKIHVERVRVCSQIHWISPIHRRLTENTPVARSGFSTGSSWTMDEIQTTILI